MPKSFTKHCLFCGALVKTNKGEWKFVRKNVVPTTEDPDLGKAVCWPCQEARYQSKPLYPFSVWEVTDNGFRHTLVGPPVK